MISRNGKYLMITGHVVPDTAPRTIWPEASIMPTLSTRTRLSVSSTSANDTKGGSGASSVLVQGYNENGNRIEIAVDLRGQTPVYLNDMWTSLEYVKVQKASSSGNLGIIRVGSGAVAGGVPAVVYEHIPIGEECSQALRYTVPNNYALTVHKIQLSRAVSHEVKIVVKNVNPDHSLSIESLIYSSGPGSSIFELGYVFDRWETFTLEVSEDSGSGEPIYAKAYCELSKLI